MDTFCLNQRQSQGILQLSLVSFFLCQGLQKCWLLFSEAGPSRDGPRCRFSLGLACPKNLNLNKKANVRGGAKGGTEGCSPLIGEKFRVCRGIFNGKLRSDAQKDILYFVI